MTWSSRFSIVLLASLGVAASASPVVGQQVAEVNRGVRFLRGQVSGSASNVGENALAALALIKAEVPATDPALSAFIQSIDTRFAGSEYTPARSGGADIYEAAVVIMALANLDANGRKAQISGAARYIGNKQNPNGSWDYTGRAAGDASISQYAVLGLWEAANAGVEVHPGIWDRAAKWYLSVQSPQGSWNYHRDEAQYQETLSMTAAGVGSLLICRRQLADYKQEVAAQNPYLIPILVEGRRIRYNVETTAARMTAAANGGIVWIARNFNLSNESVVGASPFYCLYGMERVGALADQGTFGRLDWYELGRNYIASKQGPTGSWSGAHGDVVNTAWAMLFLTKSTAKSVERIRARRLGAGELLGGKGLPKDLSSISEAGGRIIARPMDGAVEGMLAVLEDVRTENADSALAGLIVRYRKDGPKSIQPYRDRFRKLIKDRDPGVRRVAAWALARMGDLEPAPALIEALRDRDDAVVGEAKSGLQLLSRKIEGFGPTVPYTPEEREVAIKAWKAWYDSARPLAVDPSENAVGTGRPSR